MFKLKKTLCLLPLLALLVTGCNQPTTSNPETSENESNSAIITKKLEINTPISKNEYYQKETLDLSGLIVSANSYNSKNEIVSSEEITDYHLIWQESAEEIHNGYVLSETGTFKIIVQKTGYESVFFEIKVKASRGFSQYLELTSLPQKISYQPGETFDSSGLSVILHTSFYTNVGELVHKSDVITDYQLTINDKDAEGFQFDANTFARNYVIIKYPGSEKELVSYFPVYNMTKTGDKQDFDSSGIETSVDSKEQLTIHITNSAKSNNIDPLGISNDRGYYTPEEVDVAYTAYDLGERNALNWKYAPSSSKDGVSKTPLLVVPVVVPGYEGYATQDTYDMLQKTFFGSGEDLHFESLRSYYYKSSRGQLDLTGTITDYFFAGDYSKVFTSATSLNVYKVGDLAIECAEWVKKTYNTDMSQYDLDSDGLIDAMWLVWVGAGYDNSGMTVYWPFSSSTGIIADEENIGNPQVNNFGWAGEKFLREFSPENKGGDAHVLIHETGHMLGLTDYYSYGETPYSPLGGVDMMDNNIGDHNPYSKMMMGWTDPYVVYGNDVTITIPASTKEDACIVIPYDDKEYIEENGIVQFNPYDEYLIVDLYSSESKLNSLGYDAYGAETVQGVGARLYHIDERLGKVEFDASDNLIGSELFANPDDAWKEENRGKIMNVISNTLDGNRSESFLWKLPKECDAYDEIRWISADKSIINSYTGNAPTYESLFQKGDVFSLGEFSAQFNNGFNNKHNFSSTFTIENIA